MKGGGLEERGEKLPTGGGQSDGDEKVPGEEKKEGLIKRYYEGEKRVSESVLTGGGASTQ